MSDSTVVTATRKQNPFRSRSTLICMACLLSLLIIDFMAMKSGYFNVEFASMSLLVLREMISASLNHQFKSDEKTGKATA